MVRSRFSFGHLSLRSLWRSVVSMDTIRTLCRVRVSGRVPTTFGLTPATGGRQGILNIRSWGQKPLAKVFSPAHRMALKHVKITEQKDIHFKLLTVFCGYR